MSLVRHCATCDTDYRSDILQCAECGADLELLPEEGPASGAAAPSEPPPGDYRAIYTSGEIGDLEPLTDALAGAGIPYRVDAVPEAQVPLPPAHNRFQLKVRDEERETAIRTLESLPDAGSLGIVDDVAERGFDPTRGYLNCPACGATLPGGADSCPECGLKLAGSLEPLFCSSCEWEVAATDRRCPHCGAMLAD